MGRRHVFGQFIPECRVVEVVAHVRQPGPLRPHTPDPVQNLLEMGMRRMRPPAEAADDPRVDAG